MKRFMNNKIMKAENLKEIKDMDIIEMKIVKDYTILS
jgi:hypothetical protein